MPTQQETYQLILQLKDEMTVALKAVNANLVNTRENGNKTAEGIKGIAKNMKAAVAPIKAFNSVLKTVFAAGGIMYGIRMASRFIGEMETAFAKAHPESQKMAGSMTQFKMAIDESKATFGMLVNEIVSPARAVIIATIQDATTAMNEFDSSANTVGETLGQVGVYTVKVFQTVGRLIYDNFNLMKIALQAIWELIKNVGEFLWLPLKKGFLLIIQPIKQAFLDMINWVIRTMTTAVNWIGEKLQAVTGGLVGKKLTGWAPEQIKMEDLDPGSVQLKTWKQMMDEAKGTFGEVGEEFQKILQAYVDIWVRKPGEAMLYPTSKPLTADELAKLIEQRKAEARQMTNEGEAERNAYWNEVIKGLADSKAFLEALDKAAQEELRLAREERRERLLQAQGAVADPLAAIGDVLNKAMESAATNPANAGNILGMISEFFTLTEDGLVGLLSSLAEFMPLILLVMAIMEVVKGVAEILGPVIMNILQPFIDFLQGIGNVIGTLLLPVLQAFEPLLTVFGTLLNGLLPIFTVLVPVFKAIGFVIGVVLIPVMGLIRGVIMFINGAIAAINWLIPGTRWDIPTVPVPAMPALPTFHEGGKAEDDMLAVLKKGEVVLNPYKSRSYIAGGGGGGGVTINAPNARYLDKGTAAELVRLGLAGMRA